MSSNLILLVSLLAGLLLGFFTKPAANRARLANRLLMATILVLIFMMGARLGLMPDLGERILAYGRAAIVITISALIFSIIAVRILVWLFMRKRGGEL
ncbi:MAG: LysO family transporter [Deferribacteraceae bacterium]|jgi:uncharacterized membrane protein YbjE (DUF340 family)|nr:LysO family transporter [Deferribacteraceae bacterium]